MKKSEMRPQPIKQPRKVEVKTLIPWTIILVGVALAVGLWLGWTSRSAYYSEIRAQVASQLAEAKPVKK